MYYQIPDVDPRLVGWICNFAKKNHYRVKSFMTKEDLLHECFDCLFDARRRYAERYKDDPKRFTATVKLMCANTVPYLLTRNVRFKTVPILDMCERHQEADFTDKLAGPDEAQAIAMLIAEAPEILKPILRAYTDGGIAADHLAAPNRRRLDGTRMTLNERLCRIVGIDPSVRDIATELRNYLSPALA